MASLNDYPPLIVVVGETASGKSALAMCLAQQFKCEIIAGDARTVYEGMDIGTAKPSPEDQALVRHHLVDVTTVDRPFTAAVFKSTVLSTITDISSRGAIPLLVGGSGLYIDSVLFDYEFNAPVDQTMRAELSTLPVKELQMRLLEKGIALPTNKQNPRHLMRALETNGRITAKRSLRPNTLILAWDTDPAQVKESITTRVDAMLAAGLEDEVAGLVAVHGWNDVLRHTIGYQEFYREYDEERPIEVIRTAIIRNTVAYAKRQRTWFRRNPAIVHICNQAQAVAIVTTWLNKLP